MSEPGFAFPPGGMNARGSTYARFSTVYSSLRSTATSDSFEDEAIRVVDSLIEKARRGK